MNLTIHEKKILISLGKKKEQTIPELVSSTGLEEASVNHASAWLMSKDLVNMSERIEEKITLGNEGKKYAEIGLPERRVLDAVMEKEKTISELSKELGEETVKIATAWVRKLNAAMIISGVVKITPEGKKLAGGKTSHETLLLLIKEGKKIPAELGEELTSLKKRGSIVETKEKIIRTVTLRSEAEPLIKKGFDLTEETSVITPEMIRTGSWKKVKLRKYDVTAPVPVINPGKKQMYYDFLDEVKEKMTAMGFKEMIGNAIQTEFWNYDALFQPQTHPVRNKRDTYYIKAPSHGNLMNKELVEAVKKAHEKGVDGSDGWKYEFSEEKSAKLMLRSHTTCLSAKKLFEDKKYPLRYFSIGRNFRRDVIDATHLPEFSHMEGIVADESLTLRDLLGVLEAFAIEIAGIENPKDIKFKAAYFPYTEPSVELFAKHPVIGWTELGGSGMFRPEMLKPLGVNVPVIAWGMGIDRLAMFKLGLNDIRDLFTQDLKKLQSM